MKKIIGPYGIILIIFLIVLLWFRDGLLFAGGEEKLSFYNYTKSLDIFSHVWYAAGTGFLSLTSPTYFPYFFILEPFYKVGVTNVLLEAATFLVLILIGTLSIFYIVKETLASELKAEWKKVVPFLAALFYFFNPFSMTQIWGRVLSYQLFSFALVPSFLLFFILSIQRKNLTFSLIAALISFFLSIAYGSPAVIVTSWAAIFIYLIFYLYNNKKNIKNIFFALSAFIFLFIIWGFTNFFWIYPIIQYGGEMLSFNLTAYDNIASLKGLAPHSHLLNVIRLIHREYYDGTYGGFSGNFFISLLSWFLPLIFLFSVATLKKVRHFGFYLTLLLISVFITIGANFPTGWLLIWLFEKIPLLQVLRNPYEKFGVNLVLAYAPFFAVGLLVFSEKFALLFKKPRLKNIFIPLFLILTYVVLVWPIWKGNFAGGVKFNNWVKVPDYYKTANDWLNSQPGDFSILHVPLLPGDGTSYTWGYPYGGIEPSEFLFDKRSIARLGYNENYYFVLLDRFGAISDYKALTNWTDDNADFKDTDLYKELAKINVRFIVLHFDTNYLYRGAISPQQTRAYLESQEGISKVKSFGELEIYKVNIPDNINLIYSPNTLTSYKQIDPTLYVVDIVKAKKPVNLYFLQQFHPDWEVYIDGEKIASHREIFSYANSWLIEKTGDYEVVIKYKPQEFFIVGKKVSIFTLISLIISIFVLTVLRKLKTGKLFV